MKTKYKKPGFAWGKAIIHRQFDDHGIKGIAICDKSASTCRKYADDKRLKKTKKGKPLTPALRKKYGNIADGIQAGYWEITGYKPDRKPRSSSLDVSDYFDYDAHGNIKGGYNCNGIFEPD